MSADSVRHLSPRLSVWRILAGGPALLALVLATGCTPPPPKKADKVAEVVVTTPITGDVLDYQDFTGRLDAVATVEVRARVSGYVNDATFKEGDMVRKGDVLFRIDARTYMADLNQAKANLGLAIADRKFQDANVTRARQMIYTKSIGREEFDQKFAERERAEANVGAMEAARDRAAVYMGYAEVVSPLSGRISRRVVDPGNLVKADDTVLTTVVADDSVYAYFDVDERTYLDLVGDKLSTTSFSTDPNMAAGAKVRLQELKLPVLMRLANEEDFVHPGYVDFVDNRLNGNTGTIRMRGVFPNPRGILKSGLFVRVRLPIGQTYKTLLIPDEALQSDQGRKYVFVIKTVTEEKEDGTKEKKDLVEYRRVTIGQAIDGLRAIKPPEKGKEAAEGVRSGEKVIISGMQRVRAAQVVKVKDQPPPNPPASPLGKLLNLARQAAGVKDPAPAVRPISSNAETSERSPPAKTEAKN